MGLLCRHFVLIYPRSVFIRPLTSRTDSKDHSNPFFWYVLRRPPSRAEIFENSGFSESSDRSETPLERSGSRRSEFCTKHQPRRPLLSPFRRIFSFLRSDAGFLRQHRRFCAEISDFGAKLADLVNHLINLYRRKPKSTNNLFNKYFLKSVHGVRLLGFSLGR